MPLTTIKTERLILRALTPGDAQPLRAIAREENILRWMPDWDLSPEDFDRLVAWYIQQYTQWTPEDARIVLAVTLPQGEMIGIVSIGNKEEVSGEMEVAYFLSAAHTGHGYMAEAVRAMADWALPALDLPFLMAIVETDNLPSQRVIERSGFERLGERLVLNAGDTQEKPFYYYRRGR